MKKPLLFTLLIATTAAQAQMTVSNESSIGETSTMYVCDASTANLAGVNGTGVTWDYSNLTIDPADTRVVDVADPATTSFASSFPNSTKVIQVENTMNTFISSSATEKISQGFTFYESSIGDAVVTYGNDTQLLATYPFNDGDAVQDNYSGDVNYTFNTVPINETLTGNSHSSIDGSGTLNLPGGLSISGVIRYKLVDTATTNIPVLNTAKLIRTQFEYYDYSDQNLPIFIHTTINLATTTGTTLANVVTVLSKFGYNNLNTLDGTIEFNAYPNPTRDKVTLTGNFSDNAEGVITDQSGRILKNIGIKNGEAIDISDLATGTYMITLIDRELRTTKTIVKK